MVPATTGEVDEYAALKDKQISAGGGVCDRGVAAEDAARRTLTDASALGWSLGAGWTWNQSHGIVRHSFRYPPMWILRASETAGSLTFRLANGTARTLGRAPTADFILDVALVSRVHCRIVASDDALDVEDLSSTNGTFSTISGSSTEQRPAATACDRPRRVGGRSGTR